MPITKNENTFSSTYKDDFSEGDNYQRILFNSGKALQARELTQMQTIIQKQMERFGRNVFKEGSVVIPGGLQVDNEIQYVRLQGTPTLYAGDILENDDGIRARVIDFIAAEGSDPASDPATVYVDYIDQGNATSSADAVTFSSENTLTNTSSSGGTSSVSVEVFLSGNTPVTGKGFKIAVNDGAYFIRGMFVQTQAQSKIISKYSNGPTTNIGFVITEDIVTVDDTNALYDNQNDLPNETAPGADRYRITLTLAAESESIVDSDTNFIITNRLISGRLQREIDENTYNIIGNELATRTREESGSYVVEDFVTKFKSKDADEFRLEISPGIAYIDGYRLSTADNVLIDVPRSQTTTGSLENENIAANYGHYIISNDIKGLPNVSELERWNLYSDSGEAVHDSKILGTARIRSVLEDGANYRYHIFDVQMNGSNNFRDTISIAADSDNYANLVLENNNAVIKEANNNNVFFQLPRIRPEKDGVDVNALTVQKSFTKTATGTSFTISSGELDGIGANVTGWIITDESNGAIVNITPTLGGTPTGSEVTYTGLPTSDGTYQILGYVSVSLTGTGERQKTLSTQLTQTFNNTTDVESDGSGLRFFTLQDYDIYSFDSIGDAAGNSITNRFITDNGQRDNFYERGRIILRSGQSIPTSTKAYYKHFEHATTATGNFFSVNSYPSSIAYEDIPTYRLRNGTEVELRNVLDFRSKKDDNGDFTGAGAYVHSLPSNTDIITADIEYYQSRKDVLVATPTSIQYRTGTPSNNPVKPQISPDTMELANFTFNPYTDDTQDLKSQTIDNRRYTMRDIGNIEKRIDKLEESVTLNLLELETSTLEVLDANGNNRFKNGFFADNFKNLVFSDIFSEQYSASLNIDENSIMPFAAQNNVRMRYNKTGSSNIVQKGDTVLLSYSEVNLINQNLATETENVNPFDVILYNGTLTISPERDEWRRNTVVGSRTVNPATLRTEERRRQLVESLIRPSEFSLSEDFGFEDIDVGVGDFIDRTQTVATTTIRRNGERVVRRVRGLLGQIVVDLTVLPFIRSRKVFFRAEGLAPNREHFVYFDKTPISGYTKTETTFQTFSDSAILDDLTDGEYTDGTTHPEGSSSELVTDKFGKITGSFFIPNNDTLRFDAGIRRVSILDIDRTADTYSEAASTSTGVANYVAMGLDVSLINLRRPPPPPPPPVEEEEEDDREGGGNTNADIDAWVAGIRNNPNRGQSLTKEPIAQSFDVQNPSGAFITSIEVFFATKPDGINDNTPITLQLRPLEAGFPSMSEVVPGGTVTLEPLSVNTQAFDNTVTIDQIRNTPTKFEFAAPVYLQGYRPYAVVLIANTQAYTVYVSKLLDFVVNDTNRRVTKQPSLGSFFMSQNAVTWTPDQFRDMMFKVNRADFVSSGKAVFENRAVPTINPGINPISTTIGDSDITILLPNSGLVQNDPVFISGLDSSTRYGGILGSTIIGEQTVKKVDGLSFQITVDSAATETALVGGGSMTTERNILMDEMIPNINSLLPSTQTTINTTAALTGGASLVTANNNTNNAYDQFDSENIVPFRLTRFESPRVIASSRIEEKEFTGGSAGRKSVTFTSTLSTNDGYISPVIDLQTLSVSTVNNLIDNQTADSATAAEPNVTFNNPIDFVADSAANSGSSLSKHITIPINLGEPAVGLKVLLAANRPSGSFFDLYFRTLPAGSDTDIETVKFVLATEDTSVQTDDNRDIFRQYEYTIGGTTGTLTPFSTFQLKIVFRSQNSSRVPRIKDLRAIALGT
jgi:hypothetical protein